MLVGYNGVVRWQNCVMYLPFMVSAIHLWLASPFSASLVSVPVDDIHISPHTKCAMLQPVLQPHHIIGHSKQ